MPGLSRHFFWAPMASAPPAAKPLPSLPSGIHAARDYQTLARAVLPEASFAYIAGGSDLDRTLAANRAAFEAWQVVPRLLRDVSRGHTRCTLAGHELAHPLLLAPLAHQRLVHALAEVESARGAAVAEAGYIASTLSSCTLEEIAGAAGPRRWFQLYVQPRRDDTRQLMQRAQAAGYEAIVLTLDAAIQLPSARAREAGFRLPTACVAANLAGFAAAPPVALDEGDSRIFQGHMARMPNEADLAWLLAESRLPVWVKGVLHADDARALRAQGVAGVIVSNHGGRGMDGAVASLQALPGVRAAVGADFPVLMDGGIRCGLDVFKALALGADAVLVGRLQVYALAVAGALGVAHMLRLLREELEVCMAMAGCATLADVRGATLQPVAPAPVDAAALKE